MHINNFAKDESGAGFFVERESSPVSSVNCLSVRFSCNNSNPKLHNAVISFTVYIVPTSLPSESLFGRA